MFEPLACYDGYYDDKLGKFIELNPHWFDASDIIPRNFTW